MDCGYYDMEVVYYTGWQESDYEQQASSMPGENREWRGKHLEALTDDRMRSNSSALSTCDMKHRLDATRDTFIGHV